MVEAFVLVRVQPVRLDEASSLMKTVKEQINRTEGVREIKGFFGCYDFVLIVEIKMLQELGTLVTDSTRNIKGVAETEPLVVGF